MSVFRSRYRSLFGSTPESDMQGMLTQAHDEAKLLFSHLSYLPDSWERTGAMGRTEEAIAYIERLMEKCR